MTEAVHAEDGCQLWVRQSEHGQSEHGQPGHGQPLVLCHGGPGLWDMFDAPAAALAPATTVVQWDQRGCGRSERRGPYTVARSIADLDAVRHSLAAARIVLLGHSWGATLALRYALQHRDRVGKLVYVSGTGIDPGQPWKPAYKQHFRHRLGGNLARWQALRSRARTPGEEQELAILQWSAEFADEGTAMARAQDMATPWFAINYECNAAINAEMDRYLDRTDVAAQCRSLDVPTLIIDGAADIRPRWAVDTLHQALPDVRRITLAGAGHLPWVEDPGGFRAAVTSSFG